MDHFRDRDFTGYGSHSHSPPVSFSTVPSRSDSSWRTYPPTPQPSYSSSSLPHSALSLGPIRNITPPEDTASLREEQREVVKDSKSQYHQVREYVNHFKDWRSGVKTRPGSLENYEKNLSIKISMKDWIKLSSDLNCFETDARYPRYSYNSSTSTLIVQFMPSPLHESVIPIFNTAFVIARESLPASVKSRIDIVANEDTTQFRGLYKGSEKTPDLAIKFENAEGDIEVKFVLEVGFAERYNDLVQDAKMWLEGMPNVSMVVLVNFQETPDYHNPLRNLSDEDFEQLGFPEAEELKTSMFGLAGDYGPAMYKGLAWVGQVSTAVVEIWKRNPTTGLATQVGDCVDLLTPVKPQIEFRLSEILDIAPADDCTIHFEWDDYQHRIKKKIQALAVLRCARALYKRAGLADIRDCDYQPSSQDSSQS